MKCLVNWYGYCCLLLFFLLMPWQSSATGLSHYAILEQCDQARGNLEGVSWNVAVEASEQGKTNFRTIYVRSRGFDMIAETLLPPRRKGHMLVLVKGNMWFYKPDLSKPVPVSQRQKLLGLAANGDIASTNYAKDYEVLNQTNENIDGEDGEDGEKCIVFDLKAKTGNASYRMIKYWVSRKRLVGIKAEFYTAQGEKLLKSARMEYNNLIIDKDGERPFISRMAIYDELMSDNKTILNFSNPVLESIPSHVFNLNLLRK